MRSWLRSFYVVPEERIKRAALLDILNLPLVLTMKKSLIFALLATSFFVAACGKHDESATKVDAAKATTSATKKADDQPRQATYDPNLKPAEIVWDSPEKKKAWEARQAQLKAEQGKSSSKK